MQQHPHHSASPGTLSSFSSTVLRQLPPPSLGLLAPLLPSYPHCSAPRRIKVGHPPVDRGPHSGIRRGLRSREGARRASGPSPTRRRSPAWIPNPTATRRPSSYARCIAPEPSYHCTRFLGGAGEQEACGGSCSARQGEEGLDSGGSLRSDPFELPSPTLLHLRPTFATTSACPRRRRPPFLPSPSTNSLPPPPTRGPGGALRTARRLRPRRWLERWRAALHCSERPREETVWEDADAHGVS